MEKRFWFLIAGLLLATALAGCLAPVSAPDTPATEAVIMTRIFATLTAVKPRFVSASSATPEPTNVPSPTRTTIPSPTAVPFTTTPSSSATPEPTIVTLPSGAAPQSPTPVPPTLTPARVSPALSPSARPSPTVVAKGATATLRSDLKVNVRTGPGTGYAAIGSAQKGDKLPVLGRNADGTWLKVTLPDGRSGWILATTALLNVPVDKVPVEQAIPTPAP